jgi:DNA polymerase III epsilon subunit-like protein
MVFGNAALLLIAVVAGAWGVFYLWLLRPLTTLTRFAVIPARRDFAGVAVPSPPPILENRRILTTEIFYRLGHPGRPIPQRSVRFHGITDDMVRDKPPARVVLPQFKDFVDTATLVAHNAAFDLQFLTLKASEYRVVFDNPVLDTLLLSAYPHDHLWRHAQLVCTVLLYDGRHGGSAAHPEALLHHTVRQASAGFGGVATLHGPPTP